MNLYRLTKNENKVFQIINNVTRIENDILYTSTEVYHGLVSGNVFVSDRSFNIGDIIDINTEKNLIETLKSNSMEDASLIKTLYGEIAKLKIELQNIKNNKIGGEQ